MVEHGRAGSHPGGLASLFQSEANYLSELAFLGRAVFRRTLVSAWGWREPSKPRSVVPCVGKVRLSRLRLIARFDLDGFRGLNGGRRP